MAFLRQMIKISSRPSQPSHTHYLNSACIYPLCITYILPMSTKLDLNLHHQSSIFDRDVDYHVYLPEVPNEISDPHTPLVWTRNVIASSLEVISLVTENYVVGRLAYHTKSWRAHLHEVLRSEWSKVQSPREAQ